MFQPGTFSPKFFGVPTIKIEEQCLHDMWHVTQEVNVSEVGWLVIMHEDEKTGDLILSEIVVPKQDCHGATTELNSDGLAEVAMQLMAEDDAAGIKPSDDGYRANHCHCWVHSHVNMGVGPSGQDDQQMEEFCRLYEGTHVWVRGIVNKKGDMEFTVYYKIGDSRWIPIRDVPWEPIASPDSERRAFWRELVKDRVKTLGSTVTSQASRGYNYYSRASQHGRGGGHGGSRIVTPEDRRFNGGKR